MVYWSDLTEGVIYRSRIEGNDKSVLLNMSNGIGRVDGKKHYRTFQDHDWEQTFIYLYNNICYTRYIVNNGLD